MAKETFSEFQTLPPGAITPEGWLKNQLVLVNDLQKRLGALPGLLRDGEWESGETLPRYVRGLVLLSGVLSDKNLREKAESYIAPIISSANAGGDFGPKNGVFISPKIEAVKTLLSYYELTGDEAAAVFLKRFFKNQFNTFALTPCWYHSRARLLEEIPALEAVYKATDLEWLVDLGETLRETSEDWFRLAAKFPFKKPAGKYVTSLAAKKVRKTVEAYETPAEDSKLRPLTVQKADSEWKKRAHRLVVQTSGVSLAKAVKYPCVYGRFVGDDELRELSLKLIAGLDKYHGNATGMFGADFRLAGTSPTRGIDLESAVEMIESLVTVLASTGEAACADMLEQIAFNVVPAAAFDDVTAVQDVLTVNQEEASVGRKAFFRDSAYGNAFVSNRMSRGAVALLSAYPMFMKSLCMIRGSELNFFTYAPCVMDFTAGGTRLRIREETGYPFRNTIIFKVEEAEGDPEVKINFRVPKHTTMQLISGGHVVATGTKGISVKCILKTGSTFMLKLDIPLSVVENRDGSVSLMKGSVLMASKLAGEIKASAEDKCVYDVNFRKKWNFAPVLSKKPVSGSRRLYDNEQTVVNSFSALPFDHDKPPFELKIRCKNVANWDYDVNGFSSIPSSPEFSEESIERTFVPFGCTGVRMAHFPPCFKG